MSTNLAPIPHCTDYEELVRKQLSNSLLSEFDESITSASKTTQPAPALYDQQKSILNTRRLSSSSCDLTDHKSTVTPINNGGIYSKHRARSYDSREDGRGLNGADVPRSLKRVTYEDQQSITNGLQQPEDRDDETQKYSSQQELSQYLDDTLEPTDGRQKQQGQDIEL